MLVALAREAYDGLGDEAPTVRDRLAVFEVGIEGLDGGDGQFSLAAPAEGEARGAGDAKVSEGGFEGCQELGRWHLAAGRAVWRTSLGVLDGDVVTVDDEFPARAESLT
ncbi:MAG: hypothetical protein WA895_21050 [Streptosporangiaceae bacterium]